MGESFLNVTTENEIGVITISRPPANVINHQLLQELETAVDDFAENDAIRAVIILGEGKYFASGADIKEFTEISHANQYREQARVGQKIFRKIELLPKPVIAAVHGAALGGGLELIMACHLRLVTKDAKLGLPELKLGLIPGFGGTQRLPNLVGKSKAVEMMLSSDPITGEEAVQWGLANRTADESTLYEEALAFATKLTRKSKDSIRAVLELANEAEKEPIERGQEKESVYFGDIAESKNGQEGIHAFLEKREPQFYS
ncbi:enoyl-CoA hydratase [Salisediminibacterium halotolerans]|uniref:enoyl-CoA hydratase n=1 Tax=Salisediminibacterium halotolerans TaxID=517425 RepID=UPI000EAC3877|nr:enoyl-CoA hydratase [Salisediminibacterium halotolerans]RLJ81128.1 short chain enoyl-CoA hydratase [Actinophytocola xinjiangensis]RPE84063.1 short chain enoyl-CoA hydratase [Salisediminibacterium halotolerans]TWG38555.1 short chain enoyl-CoA hydratase [Salisediminibacterium halotolerans]GEL07169.1 enoyl-CoA hydratase [Salisediminibacterium halotolerans]